MPQIFHRSFNTISRVMIFGAVFIAAGLCWFAAVIYRSSYVTESHIALVQPVPFSHAHHVGQLGIDCRYCHTSVETSAFAGIPPTKTCMNCHQQIWVGSSMLEPVRESYRTGNMHLLHSSRASWLAVLAGLFWLLLLMTLTLSDYLTRQMLAY